MEGLLEQECKNGKEEFGSLTPQKDSHLLFSIQSSGFSILYAPLTCVPRAVTLWDTDGSCKAVVVRRVE